jgi:hypothetical protein
VQWYHNRDAKKEIKDEKFDAKSRSPIAQKLHENKKSAVAADKELTEEESPTESIGEWKKDICPASGKDYWYNAKTDESTYDDPYQHQTKARDATSSDLDSTGSSSSPPSPPGFTKPRMIPSDSKAGRVLQPELAAPGFAGMTKSVTTLGLPPGKKFTGSIPKLKKAALPNRGNFGHPAIGAAPPGMAGPARSVAPPPGMQSKLVQENGKSNLVVPTTLPMNGALLDPAAPPPGMRRKNSLNLASEKKIPNTEKSVLEARPTNKTEESKLRETYVLPVILHPSRALFVCFDFHQS